MKKVKTNYVQAYRLSLARIEATELTLGRMEDLKEYLSPCCIVSSIDSFECFIVADCEVLSAAEMKSKCEYFLGADNYELQTAGLLGPYKRVF